MIFNDYCPFPRILRQAARLYLQNGLKVYTKPEPCSSLTIREAPQPIMERLGMKGVTRFLRRLNHGQITMTLPKGEQLVFGRPDSLPQVAMTTHRPILSVRA